MSDKKRVLFLQDRTVKDHRVGTSEQESYKKGKSYTLPAASADRWVRRGVAEYVGARSAKPTESKVKGGTKQDPGPGGGGGQDDSKPKTRAQQAAAAVKSQ